MPSRLQALVLCLFVLVQRLAADDVVRKQDSVQLYLYGARNVSECKFETKILLDELHSLSYPPGWIVGLVCTSLVWEEVRQRQDLKPNTRAFTYLAVKTTVFDGAIFRGMPNEYHHIVAHELGHIKCQCGDEDKVEELAAELEKESRLKLGVDRARN